jgi:starvation-inducible DNA-binding protein
MKLRTTRHDLLSETRDAVASILVQRLADTIDLQQQAKHAHWNVRGSNFAALHKLFDEIAESLGESADLLAERAVQLGAVAPGTVRATARATTLPEYPAGIVKSSDHIAALATATAALARSMRADIDAATQLADAASADVLTEVTRGLDQWLWFLEAHEE